MKPNRARKTGADQRANACRPEEAGGPGSVHRRALSHLHAPVHRAGGAHDRPSPHAVRLSLVVPGRERPPPRLPWSLVLSAAAALLAAALMPMLVRGMTGRFLTLSALALSFFLSTALAVLVKRAPPMGRMMAPELIVDASGIALSRTPGSFDRVLSFSAGFGMTAFTSLSRDRFAMAITTPRSNVCIATVVGSSERRLAALASNAVLLDEEDLRYACILPDGQELEIEGHAMMRLIRTLVALDPRALERCYLSDARGSVVVLEGNVLRAGTRTFNLSEPFEWGASVFQEHAGLTDACFQATWVRQAHDEIAFVSLLGANDRTSLHEVLPPPARELRHAVDRVFMVPLRRALLGATSPRGRAARGSASA